MLFPKLSKSAQSLVVGWVESDSRAITRGSLDECPAIGNGEQTLHLHKVPGLQFTLPESSSPTVGFSRQGELVFSDSIDLLDPSTATMPGMEAHPRIAFALSLLARRYELSIE